MKSRSRSTVTLSIMEEMLGSREIKTSTSLPRMVLELSQKARTLLVGGL